MGLILFILVQATVADVAFGADLDEAFHTSSYNSIKQLIWPKSTTAALFTVKDFRQTFISTQ